MSWKCSYMNKDPKEIINCLPWTKFHQKLFTNCLPRWQKSKDTDTMKVLEINIYRHQICILCQIFPFNAKVIAVKSFIFLGKSLPRITRHIFLVASLYPISSWISSLSISSSLSSLSSNYSRHVTIFIIHFSVVLLANVAIKRWPTNNICHVIMMMRGFHPETSLCQLSKREIFNFENLWKLIRSKLSANVERAIFVHTLGAVHLYNV